MAVASHYRRLVLLVGVLMLMGCALQASTLAGPPAVATALAFVVLVAAFGVSIAMAITVYRLMSRLEVACRCCGRSRRSCRSSTCSYS